MRVRVQDDRLAPADREPEPSGLNRTWSSLTAATMMQGA